MTKLVKFFVFTIALVFLSTQGNIAFSQNASSFGFNGDYFDSFGEFDFSTTTGSLNFTRPDGPGILASRLSFDPNLAELKVMQFANDGNARVVVENIGGSADLREMFRLVNNGGSQFAFEDTSIDSTWFFSSNRGGNFNISLAGTGGTEFAVQRNGQVRMGPGTTINFDLRSSGDLFIPNGNLTIGGTLFQASDKNLKDDFEPINEEDVLKKISEMPVTKWRYKKDSSGIRHIGPTAQDFQKAFGLGKDDTSIATVDTAGVSFAAIKALNKQLQEKDEKIAELEQTSKSQSELLEDFSKRLESLESK